MLAGVGFQYEQSGFPAIAISIHSQQIQLSSIKVRLAGFFFISRIYTVR